MNNYISVLLLCLPILCYSQDSLTFSNSNYFETMRTKLNLTFGLDNDVESFVFDDGISNLAVRPNKNFRITVALNHKFLDLKFGFSPKFLGSENVDEKGSTKIFEFAFNLLIKNWMQVLEFSNVRGYYVENLDDDDFNLLQNLDYFLLPNMRTRTFRGITSYKFNDKYSIRSLINHSEIQRKSAGSFIASFNYDYFKMSGSTSIQKFESINVFLSAAYFYTFVIKKNWYFNLGAEAGSGVAFNHLLEDEEKGASDWTSAVLFDLKSRVGFGYNSESFYGGVSYQGTATTQDKYSVIKFGSTRGVLNVFFGYRFKSPKFVDKSFNWVEDKIPLN